MSQLPARAWPPQITRTPIEETGVAAPVLRAAVPGRRHRVLGYNLVADGTVGIEWRSDATPLTGRMGFTASAQVRDGNFGGGSFVGVFETEDGEALILDIDAAQTLAGHLETVLV